MIKDSGERAKFESGMVRDTTTDKIDYTLLLDGPMLDRWAKYMTTDAWDTRRCAWMDDEPIGGLNQVASCALSELMKWSRGDQSADHAAAVFAHINSYEFHKTPRTHTYLSDFRSVLFPDYSLILDGPMFERWAKHLTDGAKKYDKRNWLKAATQVERDRFHESTWRHFFQWHRGDTDEDHAAAVYFNINGVEYVDHRLQNVTFEPIGLHSLIGSGSSCLKS